MQPNVPILYLHIDGLVQDCGISCALAIGQRGAKRPSGQNAHLVFL